VHVFVLAEALIHAADTLNRELARDASRGRGLAEFGVCCGSYCWRKEATEDESIEQLNVEHYRLFDARVFRI
jgi:hypothetical protein